MNRVAWRLCKDFNKERHLFVGSVTTDYFIELYTCSCGKNSFILKHQNQTIEYCCELCGNKEFYDANYALDHLADFLAHNDNGAFVYEYNIDSSPTMVQSCYSMKIPYAIDFVSEKVFYTLKPIYTVTLLHSGRVKREYIQQLDGIICKKVEHNLLQYIQMHNIFHIPLPQNRNLNLDMVTFFLQNKHLKEFAFYYWESVAHLEGKTFSLNDALLFLAGYPQKKSIKKALYRNYTRQMEVRGRYNPIFAEVFCTTMQDSNLIVKLLDLELEELCSKDVKTEDIKELVKFLKQHYSEKQITRLFSSPKWFERPFLFQDMLREFHSAKEMLYKQFQKVQSHPVALHDSFVEYAQKNRYSSLLHKKLHYSPHQLQPCIAIEGYDVRVPQSGLELFSYAENLRNCMAGYFDGINNAQTMIYCFFQDDVLKFAVEVTNGTIRQASGKYNRELSIKENKVLQKWYKQTFMQLQKKQGVA